MQEFSDSLELMFSDFVRIQSLFVLCCAVLS